MELNGRKIAISSYTSAVIDDNTIIYNEVAERIVVLNDSGAFIWEKIVEMSQQEIDLITQEIANKICQEFNIRDMIIPLSQPDRASNSEDKAVKKYRTKGTMGETETKFVQIGL